MYRCKLEIDNNILVGGYKFEGSTGVDNGCVKGQNIELSKAGADPYKIILNNLDEREGDRNLEYHGTKGLKIIVSRNTRRELETLPYYKQMKKYITVR